MTCDICHDGQDLNCDCNKELTFTVSPSENRKAQVWHQQHKKKDFCRSPIHWAFYPTGIGNKVLAICDKCGACCDVSDYDMW